MKAGVDASSLEAMGLEERLALESRLLGEGKLRLRQDAMPRRRDTGPCALSFAQRRLWLTERLNPVAGLYNIPLIYRIRGTLDIDALRAALDAIVARHEILRTRFALKDGLPQQVVAPHVPFALRVIDRSERGGVDDAAQDNAVQDAFVREFADGSFDLAADTLLRAGVLRLRGEECVLVVTLHHIAADGWSLPVLDRELELFYTAFHRGVPAAITPLPLQYSDYSEWQHDTLRGAALEKPLAYWRRQLADLPPLELPSDRPCPSQAGVRGSREPIAISAPLAAALKDLARRHNVTLYMTLLAAFQVLLMRYSGQDDVAVGSPIAGRSQPEVEGMIGFFVNTLVMRGDLSGDPSFAELLRRTRDRAIDAFAHQDLPFEKLVEEINPERDLRRTPLFQVMFSLQTARGSGLRLPDLEITRLPHETVTSKFDLTLSFVPTADRLSGSFEYSTDLFDAPTIARMAGHLRTLLEGIVANPEVRIGALRILGSDERRQIEVDWNDTASDYPRESSVPELFEAQAALLPDAVALTDGDTTLSYSELNARANRLARRLRAAGANPGDVIAIAMERSADMVVAMLAILKAGAAYVPLDPNYPAERLAFMLRDTSVRILLARSAHLAKLPAFAGCVVCPDRDAAAIAAHDAANPPSTATADSLAYVIYTSGSTGEPKGVMVPHRGIARLVRGTNYIALDASDRVAHLSNPAFDAATFEIWGALLNGARCVVLPPDVALDPRRLAARLREDRITATFVTTALFNVIVRTVPDAFAGVKNVLFGGEAVDPRTARECLAAGAPQRLVHVYGPTEAVTFATWHVVDAVAPDAHTVPIGRPAANLTVAVLDRSGQPVPVGVAGELFIGGDGIAHGYWNRPDLTAERFIVASHRPQDGARMYRTGDLVRYRANGDLEFLGRRDQQLKVRGHRVEPAELEAALRSAAALSDTLVVLREDTPGEKALVAYVVAEHGASTPTAAELRAQVQSKLPGYMVPSAIVFLPALPLTPNGKVDRDRLPAPQRAPDRSESGFVAPRDNVELHMVRIWEDLLNRDSFGIRDNFFDLGGHSLLAVQLMQRIEVTFNRRLPPDLLWTSDGTVEALVEVLRSGFLAEGNRSLVPIKAGTRQPLFVVHTMGGNLFHYYELARHLDAGQTVHGLQARGVYGAARPDCAIETIASHCIESMRTAQPEGPYLVAGFSSGGVVAFEMAHQLAAAGQRVALLALLDSYAPVAGAIRPWITELRALRRRKLRLRQLQELAYFSVLHPLKLDSLRQFRTVGEAHRWAHWCYRPRVYPHPIELFMVKDSADRAGANNLGWVRWTSRNVRIHRLPGRHGDLVKPPVVLELAARLQACIDAAGT